MPCRYEIAARLSKKVQLTKAGAPPTSEWPRKTRENAGQEPRCQIKHGCGYDVKENTMEEA